MTLELDHGLTTRLRPSKSDRGLNHLGTRAREDDLIDTRYERHNLFGKGDFAFVLGSQRVGLADRDRDRLVEVGMVRPHDQGTPRQRVIKQLVPVHVEEVGAFSTFEKQRRVGDLGTKARGHPAGE